MLCVERPILVKTIDIVYYFVHRQRSQYPKAPLQTHEIIYLLSKVLPAYLTKMHCTIIFFIKSF